MNYEIHYEIHGAESAENNLVLAWKTWRLRKKQEHVWISRPDMENPAERNLCEVAQDPSVSYMLRSSYDGFVKGSSVLVSG